ncbi:uncharacterized protein LOC111373131 [Olea europaea var. sylvestris]|uniref:uncharacterized protein LOC111373131 n=1 Tax=Olea europaea var. sylvestris TaxID=158386 RepID=UPI000C1D07D8|nr:uncharacterized protein LOC111373131 [Olea europaea var. sylvestris]
MHPHACVSMSVEVVVSHFHSLHIEINKQFEASKALYKPQVVWHKQYFEFNIGDYVILQACNAGLFKISKHVGQNTYVNDLLSYYDHHPILFVTDFDAYNGYFSPSDDPFLLPHKNSYTDSFAMSASISPITAHKNKIDVILDEQLVLTNNREIQNFLVRWMDRLDSDGTWIPKERLQQSHVFAGNLQLASSPFVEFRYLVRQRDRPPWHDLELLASDSLQHFDLSTRRGRVFLPPREN